MHKGGIVEEMTIRPLREAVTVDSKAKVARKQVKETVDTLWMKVVTIRTRNRIFEGRGIRELSR